MSRAYGLAGLGAITRDTVRLSRRATMLAADSGIGPVLPPGWFEQATAVLHAGKTENTAPFGA